MELCKRKNDKGAGTTVALAGAGIPGMVIPIGGGTEIL